MKLSRQPLIALAVVVALGGVGIALSKLPTIETALTTSNSLLAQAVSVEIRLAKQWQSHSPFTSERTLGDDGDDISILQTFLASQADDYDPNHITGYFGPITQEALSLFQIEVALAATGELDAPTRQYINDHFYTIVCPVSQTRLLPPDVTITNDEPLSLRYVPPGLVPLDETYSRGTVCLESEAAQQLEKLLAAAVKDNVKLQITSGYRRPEIQQMILEYWLSIEGESAYKEVAKPGHSEHQLGTAVDFTGASLDYAPVSEKFTDTLEYQWLLENAATYGFFLSYPEAAETEFSFEPWHWRYQGDIKTDS